MDKLTAQIGRSVYPQSQFRPYRPPNIVTLAEDGGSLLSCSQLEFRGEFALHEVEALISEGAELLAALPEFLKENTLVLRFGNPLLAPAAPEEHPPTLPINDVASRSFVLSDGKALSEAEWVVFSGGKRWVFPEDLSIAEAPWAGWIGLDDNCVFMEELSWSKFHDDYFAKRRREKRAHALSRSLFMAGSTSACDAFLAKRDAKSHPPDVRTSYGIDGTLLGWLDPQAFDGTQSAFRYTASKDGPAAPRMSATPLAEADRERLLQAGASAGLNTVPFGKARHYFAAEGMDLEFEVTEMVVDSAELFHNFDTIPSPTDLRKRACIFLWMWRVSGSPQAARAKLASTPLKLPDGADLYWDARRGSRSEKTFIMSTVALVPNAGETTDEFFIRIASRREKWVLSIRSYLRGLWPKIELATIDFWKNEVGFVFDKGKVMGTPFAIFIGADGKRQMQILRKDITSKMFPDAWKSKRRR